MAVSVRRAIAVAVIENDLIALARRVVGALGRAVRCVGVLQEAPVPNPAYLVAFVLLRPLSGRQVLLRFLGAAPLQAMGGGGTWGYSFASVMSSVPLEPS